MTKRTAVVKQNPDKEIPTEVLADSIIAIAEGVRKLRAGRLTDKALCMLIAHAAPGVGPNGYSKLSQKEVRAVLDGIDALESTYLKRK